MEVQKGHIQTNKSRLWIVGIMMPAVCVHPLNFPNLTIFSTFFCCIECTYWISANGLFNIWAKITEVLVSLLWGVSSSKADVGVLVPYAYTYWTVRWKECSVVSLGHPPVFRRHLYSNHQHWWWVISSLLNVVPYTAVYKPLRMNWKNLSCLSAMWLALGLME